MSADVERPAAWVRHLAKVGRQAVIDVVIILVPFLQAIPQGDRGGRFHRPL